MATDDIFLLQRWIDERDGEAFNELVSRHAGMVYSVCRRVLRHSADAEDVTQDCFVKLARSRMVPKSSFVSWLHSMATRVAIDHVRREARRRAVEKRFAIHTPPERQDWSEVEPYVDEAIEELPLDLRDVIIAHFIQRRTHAEIAKTLGVTRQSVSYRIRKAIEAVRDSLARKRVLQVSVGSLASILATRLVESAPPSLLASLGKLAVAGFPASSTTAAAFSATGTWTKVGGVIVMGKKISASVLLAALLISIGGFIGYLSPWKSEKTSTHRDKLAAPPRNHAEREKLNRDSPLKPTATHGKESRRRHPTIVGTVRDAKTGDPVVGAWLRLRNVVAETNAEGVYQFDWIEKADDRLTISAEGYVTVDREITEDIQESPLNVDMDRQLTILCVNQEGIPEAGVDVYVATVDGIALPQTTTYGPRTTDEKGVVQFEDVAHYRGERSLRWIYAAIGDEAAALRREHSSSIRNEADFPTRIALLRTMQVAGVVIVPEQFDAREVTVSVVRLGGNEHFIERYEGRGRELWPSLFEVRPDLDGQFSITGLPERACVDLVAEAAGLGRRGFASSNPTLLRTVELRLSPEVRIEGSLRYSDTGEAAPGVLLTASPREIGVDFFGDFLAEVDEFGRFRFQGLAPIPYVITLADSFDRSDWTMQVFGPIRETSGGARSGIELFLEEGGTISGMVHDASTQEPIRGVEIRGTSGPFDQTVVARAKTNETGRYELRIPTGQSRIGTRSVPEGYQWSSAKRSAEISAQGEHIEGLDFQLSPNEESAPETVEDAVDARIEIQGAVVRADGSAVEGVLVIIRNIPGETWDGRDFTDASGNYSFSVRPGRGYQVRVQGERISTVSSEEFDVFSGETLQLEDLIVRDANSFVSGLVVDLQGNPVEGILLIASSESKRPEMVKTDAEGRFRVAHLLSDEVIHLGVDNIDFEFRDFLVSPGTVDMRLVLHRIDREVDTDLVEKVPLKMAETMIGQVAPPWSVGEWIREPYDSSSPNQRGGKETVLVYNWLPRQHSKSSRFFDDLERFVRACRDADAVPVLILAHQAHSSVVRPELERRSLTLAVGIDRFLPRSNSLHSNNATMVDYGRGKWPIVFVIDSSGIVRDVQSGLDRIGSLLNR